ncbi:TPA: hypothetical protein ACTEH3_000897 [Streptococcus agalactiae]
MIDKDRIILEQQQKIERIEKLQEELHKISMLGMLTLKVLQILKDDTDEIEAVLNNMHKLSHVIEDVLDGEDPETALKAILTNGMFGKDDEEEE